MDSDDQSRKVPGERPIYFNEQRHVLVKGSANYSMYRNSFIFVGCPRLRPMDPDRGRSIEGVGKVVIMNEEMLLEGKVKAKKEYCM